MSLINFLEPDSIENERFDLEEKCRELEDILSMILPYDYMKHYGQRTNQSFVDFEMSAEYSNQYKLEKIIVSISACTNKTVERLYFCLRNVDGRSTKMLYSPDDDSFWDNIIYKTNFENSAQLINSVIHCLNTESRYSEYDFLEDTPDDIEVDSDEWDEQIDNIEVTNVNQSLSCCLSTGLDAYRISGYNFFEDDFTNMMMLGGIDCFCHTIPIMLLYSLSSYFIFSSGIYIHNKRVLNSDDFNFFEEVNIADIKIELKDWNDAIEKNSVENFLWLSLEKIEYLDTSGLKKQVVKCKKTFPGYLSENPLNGAREFIRYKVIAEENGTLHTVYAMLNHDSPSCHFILAFIVPENR